MKRSFRKYHRILAVIISLPVIITALTGITYTVFDAWLDQEGRLAGFILAIHTGKIVHLERYYPILLGLGEIALLVTGLSLLVKAGKRSPRQNLDS